jgi:hypothetical protein
VSHDPLIERITRVFTAPHPGDRFLQGSFDGCEPYEVVAAFVGRTDWRGLDAPFLDAHHDALAFFSEAGLRFYLPAYLVADLRDELMTADPAFGLIHGFSELAVDLAGDGRGHRSGGSVLLGARRFGAITWEDTMRHRLSVFCREEAAAIVAYLEVRRERDTLGTEVARIDAALRAFWIPRSRTAPERAALDASGL